MMFGWGLATKIYLAVDPIDMRKGFDGFQVNAARLAAVLKYDAQPPVYFTGNFLPDRFSRFVSRGCGTASSTGRKRQIRVLTSTNSFLSCW